MTIRALKIYLVVALAMLGALSGRADTVTVGVFSYDGTVNGIRNGKLSLTLKAAGTEALYELDRVVSIELDASPKLIDAERARADDAKKSAALYKQAIAAINKPEVKLLAEWRAIDPTDRDGRWAEAVAYFLDVYQSSPTEAVWKSLPAHWPDGGSKMLTEGVERVSAAIKAAKTDEARRNLKTFLVEIYLKEGNADAAGALAKEIQTGITQDPKAVVPGTVVVTGADELFAKKDYAGAVKQAAALLEAGVPAETAARLFAVEAQSYEALEKPDEAAAAWLRIPAYYPSNPAAPGALLRAAELQKRLNRPDAANVLLREILAAYPDSKEAASLKK